MFECQASTAFLPDDKKHDCERNMLFWSSRFITHPSAAQAVLECVADLKNFMVTRSAKPPRAAAKADMGIPIPTPVQPDEMDIFS